MILIKQINECVYSARARRACARVRGQGETFVPFKVPKCNDATSQSARTAERHFLSDLMFDSFDLHGRARGCVCAQTPVPCCGLVLGELTLQNFRMTRGGSGCCLRGSDRGAGRGGIHAGTAQACTCLSAAQLLSSIM